MDSISEKDNRQGIALACDSCGKEFIYEPVSPIAVTCTHCETTFDARLQIVKGLRKSVEERLEEY